MVTRRDISDQNREYVRQNTTPGDDRDDGPVEILVLEGGEQVVKARVEARQGEVVVVSGDEQYVQAMLETPLMLHRGDGSEYFIDGRIDGAGWVEALPDYLTGTYVRARRV